MKSRRLDAFCFIIIFIPWCIVLWGLFRLQIVRASDLEKKIERVENSHFRVITPKRGTLYVQDKDKNKYPVAISEKQYDVYFNARVSDNPKIELDRIRTFLPDIVTPETLDSGAIILKKGISDSQKKSLQNLHFNSLFFEVSYKRIYPEKSFLSTVLGFVARNKDGVLEGKYGVEKYYDDILRGFEVYKFGIDKAEAPVSGQDVVLSIDYFVQKEAEQTLQWAIDTFKTTGGMIVVARPNGQIIALAESPSFDPNNFSEVSDYQVFRTKFIQNYEPGSIMKALTYLSAVEKRVFNENQTYYDAGFIEINGWKISNFDKKGRGLITLGEAFEQSLNTGSVFIERLIGNIYFLNMLEKFKFDETPRVDLPNVYEGNLENLKKSDFREVNFATASYGHGISVSPAHILQFLNAIALDCRVRKLSFGDYAISDGQKSLHGNAQLGASDAACSKNTLSGIRHLMERVMKNGSGNAINKTAGILWPGIQGQNP